MDHNFKKVLLAMSALLLVASACNVQPEKEIDPAGVQRVEPSRDVQVETKCPTPTFEIVDEAGQGTAESGQGQVAPAGPKEPVSSEDPEGVPSLEERDAMLNQVNLAPGRPESDDGGGVSGPQAGTQSDQVGSVSPESAPTSTPCP